MEICRRAVEFVQIVNEEGEVRICGWQKDGGRIGRLTEYSMKELYQSNAAKIIRERHFNKDYSNCSKNDCPWVANGNVCENCIDIEEIPEYPTSLYLAYENVCNYRCVMCTIPDCMSQADAKKREEKLDKIDEEVRKILPHVKFIGAHGLGELFASKHIMQILSEWNPQYPVEECGVSLETNGSLFNEKNWAKISNLGKYNLKVHITVLSFDEETYQELSGTTLPLSNLIENLKFVKKLREQEVINYLEIATVYQDKNYKTLPEFARRCVEEFGADYVRLRPYKPWREVDMKEWFRDVRNEYHPYHKDFLEVMKNPIFKHPKVHDWGGGNVSGLGPEPYVGLRARYDITDKILENKIYMDKIREKIKDRDVVVYGMGIVGRALVNVLQKTNKIIYCIDINTNDKYYEEIPIVKLPKLAELRKDAVAIVSLVRNPEGVVGMLESEGYEDVIDVNSIE